MDLNPNSGQNIPEWPFESWADPVEEHHKLRLRLQRFRLGFTLVGIALLVNGISLVVMLFMMFTGQRQKLGLVLGIPHFELIESAIITWGSLLGVCLLWGHWPDVHWQRRSGILLMMSLVDALLWSLSHAVELGLYDGTIGHDWFRESLGAAIGWSEFALTASLAADIASHLGESRAVELSRSIRSLSTTGAILWALYFLLRTDWNPPFWPLRERMITALAVTILLAWIVLLAICSLQTTGLSLLAGSCCAKHVREMAAADQAKDVMPSRSEAGWEDMIRKSGPHDSP